MPPLPWNDTDAADEQAQEEITMNPHELFGCIQDLMQTDIKVLEKDTHRGEAFIRYYAPSGTWERDHYTFRLWMDEHGDLDRIDVEEFGNTGTKITLDKVAVQFFFAVLLRHKLPKLEENK